MLNGLDLFSGIGGIQLGLSAWVSPVAYCEADRYCQGVLLSRMSEGKLAKAPIWDDVRTITGNLFKNNSFPSKSRTIDIISGGFPCQDISVAGTGKGLAGSRSGLFFEIIRLVGELRPRFVFLENVPAIAVRGLDRVLLEFTSLGFDCRWTIVSAAEMGAPHLRERWFLLAHANSPDSGNEWKEMGRNNPSVDQSQIIAEFNGESEQVADTAGIRSGSRTCPSSEQGQQNDPMREDWWAVEPGMGRVANGVSHRVDRLHGLGNAVVPIQAREAFKRLMGL